MRRHSSWLTPIGSPVNGFQARMVAFSPSLSPLPVIHMLLSADTEQLKIPGNWLVFSFELILINSPCPGATDSFLDALRLFGSVGGLGRVGDIGIGEILGIGLWFVWVERTDAFRVDCRLSPRFWTDRVDSLRSEGTDSLRDRVDSLLSLFCNDRTESRRSVSTVMDRDDFMDAADPWRLTTTSSVSVLDSRWIVVSTSALVDLLFRGVGGLLSGA